MTDMFFNARGSTHSLRLLFLEDGEVWEALVDGDDYYHFEAPEDSEIWELFSLAIAAYMGYAQEAEMEKIDWGGNHERSNGYPDHARTTGHEPKPSTGCGCA